MTRAEATRIRLRAADDAAKARRREAERSCSLDFLRYGDLDGRHSEKCIRSEACSREYNLRPYAEADPDPRLYEGTGIGLLYGMAGPQGLLFTLRGWNLVGRRERSIGEELHDEIGTDHDR